MTEPRIQLELGMAAFTKRLVPQRQLDLGVHLKIIFPLQHQDGGILDLGQKRLLISL